MARQGICEAENVQLFLLKWALIVVNILFWAMGVAAFAIGMWLYIENNEYAIFSDGDYLPGSVLLLACGFSVIIVGFLGIVAAVFESKIMAFAYSALLVMAMILYLSAGIWAVDRNDEDQLREDIQQFLIVSLDDYIFNRDFNETWNDMQRELQCCGVFNSSSWLFRYNMSQINRAIPPSCCVNPPCMPELGSPELHSLGCVDALVEYHQDQLDIIGPVGIAFGISQVLGVIVCVLFIVVLFLSKDSYDTNY